MAFDHRKYEQEQDWRKSEFVISYPNKASRLSYTLHRANCKFLTVEYRIKAQHPAVVSTITLDGWAKQVAKYYYAESKVCGTCCSDLFDSAPIVVHDDRGHDHIYSSTNAYKLEALVAELNEAQAEERKIGEQLRLASNKANAIMVKVEAALPLDMTMRHEDGVWALVKWVHVS